MSEHMSIAVALLVVAICSVTAVVALPALVIAAARGSRRATVRLGVVTLLAGALAIVVAAVVGGTPADYSTFL